MKIVSSDVTVDCGGNTIESTGYCRNTIGISVARGVSNVTIKNCVIKGGFEFGILFEEVNDVRVFNTVVETFKNNIWINKVDGIEIANVMTTGGLIHGISMKDTFAASMSNVYSCGNGNQLNGAKDINIENSEVDYFGGIICNTNGGKCDVPIFEVEASCENTANVCEAIM